LLLGFCVRVPILAGRGGRKAREKSNNNNNNHKAKSDQREDTIGQQEIT